MHAVYPGGVQVQVYHPSADPHGPSWATVLHDATPVPHAPAKKRAPWWRR